MATIVDILHAENKEVLAYLDSQKEISQEASLAGKLAKVLVISAASYFEFRITAAIGKFAVSAAKGNLLIVSLIKQKAIDRQYHTYFDWDAKNVNKFLSLFGDAFRIRVSAKLKTDETLAKDMVSFLELGAIRNQLAHLNFASLALEKTGEEVYTLYEGAQRFVNFIEQELDASV